MFSNKLFICDKWFECLQTNIMRKTQNISNCLKPWTTVGQILSIKLKKYICPNLTAKLFITFWLLHTVHTIWTAKPQHCCPTYLYSFHKLTTYGPFGKFMEVLLQQLGLQEIIACNFCYIVALAIIAILAMVVALPWLQN